MELSEDSTFTWSGNPEFSMRPSPSSSYMAEFCITRVTEGKTSRTKRTEAVARKSRKTESTNFGPRSFQPDEAGGEHLNVCCSNSESSFR